MKRFVKQVRQLAALASVALALVFGTGHCPGQDVAAAIGPGTYVQVGGSASIFQADYGQRYLGGNTAFIDAHLYRRIGLEAEARFLRLHEDEGAHQTTYLVGPRISIYPRTVRPYVKVLAGRGLFTFPFLYARGSYFVWAPGGGLDYRVRHGRMTIRVVDFEYQFWPQFTFGALHPYGVSSGVAFRVF